MLVFGVQTVGQSLVDHGGGDALFEVIDDLFRGLAGGVEVGFVGVGAQVGHHQVGHVGDALFAGFVLGIDVVQIEELAFSLHRPEILFVDDPGPGAVDQGGAGLHQLEKFAVDHAPGLVVFGDVERHEVGFGEDALDGTEFHAQLLGQSRGDHGIVAQDLDLETGKAFHQQLADVAQSQNTHGLAGDLVAHELALFPEPRAGCLVRGDHVPGGSQHEGDDLFGHGVGVGAGGVHHVHVALAGVLDVDGVEAGSGPDDELQLGEQIDEFGGDLLAADDHHLGVGVGLEEVGDGRGRIEDARVITFGEPVGREFIEFCRDQNFSHDKTPPWFEKRFLLIYSLGAVFSNHFPFSGTIKGGEAPLFPDAGDFQT